MANGRDRTRSPVQDVRSIHREEGNTDRTHPILQASKSCNDFDVYAFIHKRLIRIMAWNCMTGWFSECEIFIDLEVLRLSNIRSVSSSFFLAGKNFSFLFFFWFLVIYYWNRIVNQNHFIMKKKE